MFTRNFRALALLGFVFGVSVVAQADVVFDTFAGPGNGMDTLGWTLADPTYYLTRSFTVSGTFGLDSLSAGLFKTTSTDTSVDITLFRDSGSGLPGQVVETWRESLAVGGLHTVNSVSHPLLTTGTYHFGVGNGSAAWGWVRTGDLHHAMLNSGTIANGWGNPFDLIDITARVNASPVPEPASLAVLGLGMLSLVRRRKR